MGVALGPSPLDLRDAARAASFPKECNPNSASWAQESWPYGLLTSLGVQPRGRYLEAKGCSPLATPLGLGGCDFSVASFGFVDVLLRANYSS